MHKSFVLSVLILVATVILLKPISKPDVGLKLEYENSDKLEILFYNKLPKSGSSFFLNVLRHLEKSNNFELHYIKSNREGIYNGDKLKLLLSNITKNSRGYKKHLMRI